MERFDPRSYIGNLRQDAETLCGLLADGWSLRGDSGTIVAGPNGTTILLLRGVITRKGERPIKVADDWTFEQIAAAARSMDAL